MYGVIFDDHHCRVLYFSFVIWGKIPGPNIMYPWHWSLKISQVPLCGYFTCFWFFRQILLVQFWMYFQTKMILDDSPNSGTSPNTSVWFPNQIVDNFMKKVVINCWKYLPTWVLPNDLPDIVIVGFILTDRLQKIPQFTVDINLWWPINIYHMLLTFMIKFPIYFQEDTVDLSYFRQTTRYLCMNLSWWVVFLLEKCPVQFSMINDFIFLVTHWFPFFVFYIGFSRCFGGQIMWSDFRMFDVQMQHVWMHIAHAHTIFWD